MIDQEYFEQFIRAKILLREKLLEIGSIPGSAEIKSQMTFVETRTIARIKQDLSHAAAEMNALRFILFETAKSDPET